MNYDLLSSKLESKTPIATGVVSDTGWSKQADFREYFSSLCLKHILNSDGKRVFSIVNGHRSHIFCWKLWVGFTERYCFLYLTSTQQSYPPALGFVLLWAFPANVHCWHKFMNKTDIINHSPFQHIWSGLSFFPKYKNEKCPVRFQTQWTFSI